MNNGGDKSFRFFMLVIISIIAIIFAVKYIKKRNDTSKNVSEEKLNSSAININDEVYKDMKIYEEDGDIVIESKDGGKTIETTKKDVNNGMVETTSSDREKYTISNVNVIGNGGMTQATGTLTNNDSVNHDLVVNIKFYSEDNKIKGASSKTVSVEANKSANFNMTIMGDVSQYKYEIIVEYAK